MASFFSNRRGSRPHGARGVRGPDRDAGKPCFAFQRGECHRGTACKFSHGSHIQPSNEGRVSEAHREGRNRYDWRKHLSHNNPSHPLYGLSKEEIKQKKKDPLYQEQRQAFREERRQKKNEKDREFLAATGIDLNSILKPRDPTADEKAEQEKKKLARKLKDMDPEHFWIPKEHVQLLSKAVQQVEENTRRTKRRYLASGGNERERKVSSAPRFPGASDSKGASTDNEIKIAFDARHKKASFSVMKKQRTRLPAYQHREKIIKVISDNRVVVVSGETGCGKTTQIPQLVLENAINSCQGTACNIICTQPRRISAIGVAERVSDEMCQENVGAGLVGYQIRLERRACAGTKLLYCTNGILLRRLQVDPLLQGVSHVILDEVHERNVESDFLLIVLRDLLARRQDIHIVLMSATLNADMFANYFQEEVAGEVPKLHIPGFTFPVEDMFLEDALEWTGYDLCDEMSQSLGRFGSTRDKHHSRWNRRDNKHKREGNAKKNHLQSSDQTAIDVDRKVPSEMEASEEVLSRKEVDEYRQLLKAQGYCTKTVEGVLAFNNDDIPYGIVTALVEQIDRSEPSGAILIFLTGFNEISKLHERLQGKKNMHWILYPLHGSMPTSQQREIFKVPPESKRKIVIATNIAESSITIEDVVYVIDCGKHKEKTYDEEANLACLLPAWVSRASAHQRRGRAGRVQPGKCWHIFPRRQLEKLDDYQSPEIVRTPLEQLCLQVRALKLARDGLGGIKDFVSKALTPPKEMSLINALSKLKGIGALRSDSEDLTPLGAHLAMLPMEPAIGKALVYATLFNCLEPVLTITAILSYRSPFLMPLEHKDKADRAKRRFANGEPSDHKALLEAYNGWLDACRRGESREFCWRNFLSEQTLRLVRDMREQYRGLLHTCGLIGSKDEERVKGVTSVADDWGVVKAVLVAGLYPNLIRIDPGKHRFKTSFITKSNGKVTPHPGSVNASHNIWEHRWMVYYDKQRTVGGIFVYDTTEISPLPIILLGGVGGQPFLKFDSKGYAWGTQSNSEVEVVRHQDEPKHPDPTVQFVKDFIVNHGGSFGMAKLMGLLKRNFYEHRERIGSIRSWVTKHDDVFHIDKRGGKWTISSICVEGSSKQLKKALAGETTPPFFGVEDWVYFRGDESTADLMFRCKCALNNILQRRIGSPDHSVIQSESMFLSAIRSLLVQNDLAPYKS